MLIRKYNRQLKALRMAARSSLYKKDISAHVHQYQDEVYHEDKVSFDNISFQIIKLYPIGIKGRKIEIKFLINLNH